MKGRFKEYLFVTFYGWIFFNLVLTPFALFLWKLSLTQFVLWWFTDLPVIPVSEYAYYRSVNYLVKALKFNPTPEG